MFRIASLILPLALLVSCASMQENQREQDLAEALLQYEKAVRWSDFNAADNMRRLPAEAATATPPVPADIRITSYREIGRRDLADGTEVEIAVRIDYYHNDTLKVSSLVDQQHWRYDADAQTWHITTPLPAFR